MADCLRFYSLIARAAPHSRASAKRLDPAWSKCPLADRQGGATLARFGQTAGPSLIKFGTREGGREGGEGRGGEGRGGEGRGGEGSEGRGGEGRGGEGRGGEGTVHTFHKPEPLWPRSLAGHPRSGWPASKLYYVEIVYKSTNQQQITWPWKLYKLTQRIHIILIYISLWHIKPPTSH